jgi:hypothetical protein
VEIWLSSWEISAVAGKSGLFQEPARKFSELRELAGYQSPAATSAPVAV